MEETRRGRCYGCGRLGDDTAEVKVSSPLRSNAERRWEMRGGALRRRSSDREAAKTWQLPRCQQCSRLRYSLVSAVTAGADEAACTRRPVVFAFGDSNTDTGGAAAALGNCFPLPEGRAHFRRSTGRRSTGRLVIDSTSRVSSRMLATSSAVFHMSVFPWDQCLTHDGERRPCTIQLSTECSNGESLNMSYLSPYLQALGSDFSNGANFDDLPVKLTCMFRPGFEEPLMACCGHGGPPYNYDLNVSCLGPGYRVCEDGSKFLSWDGVHYTDAVVAAKILSAEFSTRVPFGYFCKA
ncbi:hypothetical protein ACQ4PT_041445 [Festuca glaucescens]